MINAPAPDDSARAVSLVRVSALRLPADLQTIFVIAVARIGNLHDCREIVASTRLLNNERRSASFEFADRNGRIAARQNAAHILIALNESSGDNLIFNVISANHDIDAAVHAPRPINRAGRSSATADAEDADRETDFAGGR